MNICYLGALQDYSGYGEANRNDVGALLAAGVNVLGRQVSYVREVTNFGSLGDRVRETIDREGDYRIKILHTTPDQYKKHIEPGKYHIGRFFWETDKIPRDFAEGLSLCDEIWTGSVANAEAIKKAGVDVTIYIIPQAIETEREWPEGYEIEGFDGFLFYSIFEWIDRKNPEALLRAYFQEFQNGENVGLLVKSYHRNFNYQNRQFVLDQANFYKNQQNLANTPPLFLYRELMDRRQVSRLHMTGDVFVSAHRGEGWGLPQVEAMLSGHPIISTGYGGVHEYVSDDCGFVLPYSMAPLQGMRHSSAWYTPDQNWAEPSVEDLRKAMRFLYENQEKSKEMGTNAKKLVLNQFNFQTVGSLMVRRLNQIEESL